MTGVEVTRQPGALASLGELPDPVALVAAGMAVAPYPVRLRLRVPLDEAGAVALIPRTVGVHTPDSAGPGATVVEVGAGSVEGMIGWVTRLGMAVAVLSPPEVRAGVRAAAEALAAANAPRPS